MVIVFYLQCFLFNVLHVAYFPVLNNQESRAGRVIMILVWRDQGLAKSKIILTVNSISDFANPTKIMITRPARDY